MSERLMNELERENLCTHFILPLIRLNKFSFISSNFVNSFLVDGPLTEDTLILVQVVETSLLSRVVTSHPMFRGRLEGNGAVYLRYVIPRTWGPDVGLFKNGKYSLLSDSAKECIIRFGSLDHKVKADHGKVETDGRLLALDKHKALRDMWERELQIYLEEGAELLSIPGPGSYITMNGLTEKAQR